MAQEVASRENLSDEEHSALRTEIRLEILGNASWFFRNVPLEQVGFYDRRSDFIILDGAVYYRYVTAVSRRSWGEIKREVGP